MLIVALFSLEALCFPLAGDAHLSLHLTNRDRGGNSDPSIFTGRKMNLRSFWDNGIVTMSRPRADKLHDSPSIVRPLVSFPPSQSNRTLHIPQIMNNRIDDGRGEGGGGE